MAKMDEIMEVLTQEIAGFNKSIGKLEELSEKFDNQKIQTDTTILESRLDDFRISQKRTVKSYENRMEEVLKTIEKSRWTPKWEVALLYIFLSVNTIAFGYFGYYFISYDLKMRDAVNQAKHDGLGRARGYFKDHEVIYRDFKRWAKKQDSISNQKWGCALSGFCFTLICRNATKTGQDPCAGKLW